MLWPDRREIESGGNRVRLFNLSFFGLHHRGLHAEVNPDTTMFQRRAVFSRLNPVTAWLYANQTDAGFINKIGEHTDGVRTAAHAGDNGVRQTTFFFQNLRLGFFTDHPLELTHNSREGVRTCRCTEHIVRGIVAARPVAQRFVTGIFQRCGTAVNGDNFCTHQTHTENVRRLTFNIFRAHVNTAFQPQQCAGESRCNTVLPRACFGDNFRFTHALRQQRLAQHLVGFVRAAVQ